MNRERAPGTAGRTFRSDTKNLAPTERKRARLQFTLSFEGPCPNRSHCARALAPEVRLLLAFALFLSLAPVSSPSGSAVFTYRRIFKSSTPEFIEIKIDENSDKASYEIRQLDEDPGATPFEISPALRQKIFELTAQLNHFSGLDLDIHRKIANLGEKTFRWERGSEAHEVKFNYTVNTAASQLLQLCEGLARQQELVELLQRRIKYDRLGVNDALLELETDLSKGVLPEPQQLLPQLDQISGDYRFVEIARQRARALAERVRHSSRADLGGMSGTKSP